jgi:predicted lipase
MEWFDKIVCIGNGTGAGVATLAAPYYSELYLNKQITCCTFGSPRVGDEMFVRWFNSKVLISYRITNADDKVSSIPFWAPYVHVHDSICLHKDGYARKSFEVSVFDRPLIYPFAEFVNLIRYCEEHTPNEYYQRLQLLGRMNEKSETSVPARTSGA